MSTATVTYSASVTQAPTGSANDFTPAVLDITYIDQNGVNQRVPNLVTPTGGWSISFTGTVGNTMGISAIEHEGVPPAIVTVTAVSSNSGSNTNNNGSGTVTTVGQQKFTSTMIPAGLTATI